MTIRSVTLLFLIAIALTGVPASPQAPPDSARAAAPDTLAPVLKPDRVAAYYFHPTIRCQSCLWIQATTDSTLRTAFAAELKSGRLEWTDINFEEPQNQAMAARFGIEGSTLILAQLINGEVVRFEPVDRTWYLVGRPAELFALVRGRVAEYLGKEKGAAK